MKGYIAVDCKECNFDHVEIPVGLEAVTNYHLTMHNLPHLTNKVITELEACFQGFSYDTFDVEVDKVYAFPSNAQREVLAMGFSQPTAIEDLHMRLANHMAFGPKPFTPHITIARKEIITTQQGDGFGIWQELKKTIFTKFR